MQHTAIPVKIHLAIPLGPDKTLSRLAYAFIVGRDSLTLIDTDVAGSHPFITREPSHISRKLPHCPRIQRRVSIPLQSCLHGFRRIETRADSIDPFS